MAFTEWLLSSIIDSKWIILFYLSVIAVIYYHKDQWDIHAKIIALYRTQWGIPLMGKVAGRFPKTVKYLSYAGIVAGFIGMIAITYALVSNMFNLLFVPGTQSAVALVIPGVKIPGSPVFVPFWYGIIAIFIVATVHEFSHGVVARAFAVKVHNSGIVFFGPIAGAFVEPDEKQLQKLPKRKQLALFAAGPFSNLLMGGLVILLTIFLIAPVAANIVDLKGITIRSVQPGLPGEVLKDQTIIGIDGMPIDNLTTFFTVMQQTKPGETLVIKTDQKEHTIITAQNPNNASLSHLGITAEQRAEIKPEIKEQFGNAPWGIFYLIEFMEWLFVLNLGIGLANLMPLGPIDGGRMFKVAADHFLDSKKSFTLWKTVSTLFLFLLIFNLVFPYFRPLL